MNNEEFIPLTDEDRRRLYSRGDYFRERMFFELERERGTVRHYTQRKLDRAIQNDLGDIIGFRPPTEAEAEAERIEAEAHERHAWGEAEGIEARPQARAWQQEPGDDDDEIDERNRREFPQLYQEPQRAERDAAEQQAYQRGPQPGPQQGPQPGPQPGAG